MRKEKLISLLPVGIFILIELAIFATNYTPATFLVGWDNVMPELNLALNLKRSLFGIWQDYRGLGLVDGLSHTANLTHTLSIWILSFVLPQSMLRYVFLYTTHLIGAVALFYLVKTLTANTKASFIAGLFYMLNLGIIQLYFAPLEAFAIHFAALPLLSLCMIYVFKKQSKMNYLILFLASFLTSAQAFVPTLFITTSLLLFFLLFFFVQQTRKVKTALAITAILFASNAFWMLPYAYSAFKTAPIIRSTKINQIASEEVFYRNKARGDFVSTLMLKGFMIDTVEYSHIEDKDVFLMQIWRGHTSSPAYLIFYSVVLLGIGYGIFVSIKEKQVRFFPFLATLSVSFLFLANNTFLLEQINALIRSLFPVFGEVFRIPFTKFETVFVFCLSIFLGVGLAALFERKTQKNIQLAITLSATALLLFLSYPVFSGYFTSPLLRLEIPKDYFQVMKFFSEKPETNRIATLPLNSFWNWQFRSWGHRGSGFLWYGIAQPMLERQFDPWSVNNEQFYNELNHASTIQDANLFYQVLKKYKVSYILLDESVKNVRSGAQPINYKQIESFLDNAAFIQKDKTFGKVVIYRVESIAGDVEIIENPTTTTSSFLTSRTDTLYTKRGDYITTQNGNVDTTLLFPNLSTEKLQNNLSFTVAQKDSLVLLSPKEPLNVGSDPVTLTIPSLFTNEFLIPIEVSFSQKTLTLTFLEPKLYVNGKEVASQNEPAQIPITVDGQVEEIRFSEMDQAMKVSSLPQKTYLFNRYPNMIEIVTDTNVYKYIIDTQAVQQKTQQFTLNPSGIDTIAIGIDVFESPLSNSNVLKKDYTIHKPSTLLYPYGKDSSFAEEQKEEGHITLTSRNNWIELSFYNRLLFHQASYMVLAESQYKSGLPVNFYVDNPFQTRPELETVLSKSEKDNVFIIPPTEEVYRGYGFHFIVKSVGTELAKSSIDAISYYPIPQQTLQEIEITPQNTIHAAAVIKPVAFNKKASYLYTAAVQDESSGYLMLNQAYDSDWKAYKIENSESRIMNYGQRVFPFIFGTQLNDHVLVNNWANGWKLSDNELITHDSKLVIFFWPQYIAFAGFLIFTATAITLLFLTIKNRLEAKT